jgi:site-specific recombinase XerD
VEAFIEHEQDRGNKITTIRTSLASVQAFLRYLVEEGIVSPDIFSRRIRLQLPERLPRAMDPDDLQKLLSVIKVAQNIFDSFNKPFLIDTHKLVVTTSIGIAVYPDDGEMKVPS